MKSSNESILQLRAAVCNLTGEFANHSRGTRFETKSMIHNIYLDVSASPRKYWYKYLIDAEPFFRKRNNSSYQERPYCLWKTKLHYRDHNIPTLRLFPQSF